MRSAEEVVRLLDAGWTEKNVDAVVALFAEDATIESPLVVRFLNRKEGVCRGRAEIRTLVEELVRRGTPWGTHDAPLVRGDTVFVEFKSASTGEPFSVDVIELRGGRIQHLRAYAGWRALA